MGFTDPSTSFRVKEKKMKTLILIALLISVLALPAFAADWLWNHDSDALFTKERFDSKNLRRQYLSADEAGKVAILKEVFANCWKQPLSETVEKSNGGFVKVENSGVTINNGTFGEKDLQTLSESARLELYAEAEKLFTSEIYAALYFKERLPVFRFWYANTKSLGKERQFVEQIKKAMVESGANDDLIACLITTVKLTPDEYSDITKIILTHFDKDERSYIIKSKGQTQPMGSGATRHTVISTSEVRYKDLLHNVVGKKLFPEKEMAKISERICRFLQGTPSSFTEPELVDVGRTFGAAPAFFHIVDLQPSGKILTFKNQSWNNAEAILKNIAKHYPGIKDSITQSMKK